MIAAAQQSEKPPWYLKWQNIMFAYLRKHEIATVNVTITANFMVGGLHIFNLAEFRSIEPTILGNWVTSPFWGWIFILTGVWLLIFQRPPRVVWGLWVSVATFIIWGTLDLAVGLMASHPVSILGPALLLFVASPVAWLAAETITEHSESEKANSVTDE